MKKLVIVVAVAIMLLIGGGVALANHYSSPNEMGLSSREFHYLEGTLFNGVTVSFTGTAGENIITIKNESKTKHIVEFEQITGPNPGYEIETALIPQNGTTTLTVNLPSGSSWKVYCPLHDTGKKKMLFYLNVP